MSRRSTKKILYVIGLAVIAAIFVTMLAWAGALNLGVISGYAVKEQELPLGGGVLGERLENPFVLSENYNFQSEVLALDSYRKVNMVLTPGRVVLQDDCMKLSISTTIEKTEKLAKSVDIEYNARPEEYDLIEEILDVFDIELEYMAIDKLEDNVFYGHMVLSDEDMVLNLDSRPSDALAIASRFGADLYVHEDIVQEYAEITC